MADVPPHAAAARAAEAAGGFDRARRLVAAMGLPLGPILMLLGAAEGDAFETAAQAQASLWFGAALSVGGLLFVGLTALGAGDRRRARRALLQADPEVVAWAWVVEDIDAGHQAGHAPLGRALTLTARRRQGVPFRYRLVRGDDVRALWPWLEALYPGLPMASEARLAAAGPGGPAPREAPPELPDDPVAAPAALVPFALLGLLCAGPALWALHQELGSVRAGAPLKPEVTLLLWTLALGALLARVGVDVAGLRLARGPWRAARQLGAATLTFLALAAGLTALAGGAAVAAGGDLRLRAGAFLIEGQVEGFTLALCMGLLALCLGSLGDALRPG